MDNVMYQQAAVSAKTKKETRRPSFLFVLGMIGTILFSFLVVSEFMKTPVYGADLGNCQYRQSDELESFESLFSDTAASAQEATGYYAQKILIPVVIFFAVSKDFTALTKLSTKSGFPLSLKRPMISFTTDSIIGGLPFIYCSI